LSFSKTFAVQNYKIGYLNLAINHKYIYVKKTAVYTHC